MELVSRDASTGEVGGAGGEGEGVDEGSLERPRIGLPDGEV